MWMVANDGRLGNVGRVLGDTTDKLKVIWVQPSPYLSIYHRTDAVPSPAISAVFLYRSCGVGAETMIRPSGMVVEYAKIICYDMYYVLTMYFYVRGMLYLIEYVHPTRGF